MSPKPDDHRVWCKKPFKEKCSSSEHFERSCSERNMGGASHRWRRALLFPPEALKGVSMTEDKKVQNKKDWYKTGWGIVAIILLLPLFTIWWIWAKSKWNTNTKWVITGIIIIPILVFSMVGGTTSNIVENNNTVKNPKPSVPTRSDEIVIKEGTTLYPAGIYKNFSELSRARFDGIKRGTPELSGIDCLDNTCNNVVYFNFSTLPSDYEMMMRSNTATYSKFRDENGGGSSVTLFAELNGKTLLECQGKDGAVKECK